MADILMDPSGWMKTVLGLDVDADATRQAPHDAVAGAPPGSDVQPTSSGATTLTISASSNGDGTFTISGSGFTATDTAHVWVADDLMKHFPLGNAPTSGGNFTYTTPNICMQPGGRRHLQANDGAPNTKPDILGTNWSNVVTIDCDPGWARKPDDPDDPSDPSDPDPAPSDSPPSDPDPASAPADPRENG